MLIRRVIPVILALTVFLSAFGLVCAAQSSGSNAGPPALFDFHSGFWINLHHFLYLEALSRGPQKGPRPAILTDEDTATLASLSPKERSAWNEAVDYYASSMITRDLLFDENMGAIKNRLEDTGDSADILQVDIPTDLKATLGKAAPIYRKHFWKQHDQENRHWIAALQPLVEKYGEKLKNSLVSIYEEPWPDQPVRVDVTIYAGQFGAYTTIGPTRPTICSRDRASLGQTALEVIFHETSHGMIQKVAEAISTAEADVNARNPKEPFHAGKLWHAVLFYTAGEVVAQQVPDYVPYAEKNGLWTRAWPGPMRSLIEQDWKPHFNGSVTLSAAIDKLVSDLAAAQSHP